MYKIANNDNREKDRLNNLTWHWHNKEDRYKEVNENANGLLFKLVDNTWYIRYNN